MSVHADDLCEFVGWFACLRLLLRVRAVAAANAAPASAAETVAATAAVAVAAVVAALSVRVCDVTYIQHNYTAIIKRHCKNPSHVLRVACCDDLLHL